MVDLKHVKNIYLHGSPVSFRKGIPSLSELILTTFEKEQIRNSLFIFFSKDKSQIKIIEFNDDGVWLYQKRLTKSNFLFPKADGNIKIDKKQLIIILNNLKPKKIRENA